MGGSSSSSRNISGLKYPEEYTEEDDQKSLILDRTGNLLSRSFGTFHRFLDSILDSSTRVADFIIEHKDQEFEILVDIYFESSSATLQFCNSLVSRFRLAKTNRLIFEHVKKTIEKENRKLLGSLRIETPNAEEKTNIVQFDDDDDDDDKEKKERFETLVEELRRLNASISGVFDEDFISLMISVHELNANLSKELIKQTNRFKSFWCESKIDPWKSLQKNSNENILCSAMMLSLKSFVEGSIVEKISEVVERLETLMEFGETRGDVDRIMEDMDELTSGIEKLGQHAEKCFKEIMVHRTRVRNHVLDIFLTEYK